MVPGNFFLGSLAGCFFIDRSVKCQKKKTLIRYILFEVSCFMFSTVLAISNPSLTSSMCTSSNWIPQLTLNNRIRHGSTPVYENLSDFSWSMFKKNFWIKSCNWKKVWTNFSNLLALDTVSCLNRGAWNWPISCLNYLETQERGLWGV